MLDWGRHRKWSFAPFTVQDVGNSSYWDVLLPVFLEVMADRVACVAFPAEAAAEMLAEHLFSTLFSACVSRCLFSFMHSA